MQVSVSNVDSREGYCQRPVCMHIWLLNALMDKLKKERDSQASERTDQ